MFGNLMGDMEAKKAEMRKSLDGIIVEEQAGDGAISIKANANRQITNISIDPTKLSSDDHEELEDLLLISINRVLEKAAAKEAEETQKLISSMLPPGMENLLGGF